MASPVSAAATSSCVESGFDAHRATRAPPAVNARTRFAVSAVTCSDAAMRTPSSGRSRSNRARTPASTGIWVAAQAIRPSPADAREGSLISLVPVVVRLVRAIDRHPDVSGLVGRELRELRPERVEVQTRDLLVEVLRQHVHLLLILVV